MTTCPPFMHSNTANESPFSDGPFIVASTRSPVERWKIIGRPVQKKRRLHDELVQERGIWCTNISKTRAMWVQVGKHSNKCVHDPPLL